MTPMIVAMSPRSTHPEPDPDSSLSVELIAFCAVGKALSSLEDPEARIRVLHWATNRFGQNPTIPSHAPLTTAELMTPPPSAAAPAPRLALAPELEYELPLEAGLSVEDLDDLFETSGHSPVASVVALVAEDNAMVPAEDDFVVLEDSFSNHEDSFSVMEDSFEAVAEHSLVPGGVEDLSDVYEPEPVRAQLHLVSREEEPFDQLVDDFVDSLRRLTRECLGS